MRVFGCWLKDRKEPREAIFAKTASQPVSVPAARATMKDAPESWDRQEDFPYINYVILNKFQPASNTGAELVDIRPCWAESIATTQIYTNVRQERMEKVVGRL